MIETISGFASNHAAELWSLGIVLLTTVITRAFRLKPKLQYSVGHAANLIVENPIVDAEGNQVLNRQLVQTASIFVENAGLNPASGVELTFDWKPQIINVMPARAYSEATHSFDRYSIVFDSLAPSEIVTVEVMSINVGLPVLAVVRSDDCVSKQFPMMPQRVWPAWLKRTMGTLTLLGLATALYLIISLVQLIAG